ncbi:MAG: SRPBCC family protein [Gaiellales bacterium]|jgi:carbon monoxide dehydrogenase subunit G|nr:SRPBCC family protein [Gaiellales bacterium]
MRIENAFEVEAAPDEVYALMLDPARVAPCIPGAEVLGERSDESYDARVMVKVGPVKMSYAGVVSIVEHDDGARTAAMRARGTEARGQGNVDATMRMAVAEREGGGSVVSVATDMQVTGRVAQMGQGIMQDVAARMIGEMARCMESMLTPAPAAEATDDVVAAPPAPPRPEPKPIKGVSLILGVLADRLRRLLRRRNNGV